MNTYTLTNTEAAEYDADGERADNLLASLRQRFGRPTGGLPVETEVLHPDGYVVEQYTRIGD